MMIGAAVHSQPCRVAEVLLAPLEPIKKQGSVKWPPSSWRWHALSSRTKRWEERVFVREGEVAGTVTTLKLRHWKYDEYDTRWHYSVLSLSNNTHKVIKSPIDLTECDGDERSFIGK
ncbi:hypothetical protein EJB05_57143, partial [Eragrostis curvula]